MTSELQKFKIFKKERDESFNIDSLDQYNLLLQFGPSDFQIGIVDSTDNKILLVEDYILPGVTGLQERLDCYAQIFNEHQLLLANFWKSVKISFKGRKFSIIPDNLFDGKNARVYLDINAAVDDHTDTIQVASLDAFGVKIIYSVETDVLGQLKKYYPVIRYHTAPQCAGLIHGFYDFIASSDTRAHCVFIDRFTLHQAVFKNRKLAFYNIFPINKFEDYTRFISMVSDDQRLDINKERIILWGFIGEKSTHLAELKKIFPGIELGRRPGGLKFGYVFDEIPEHHYFDLFGLNHLKPT